MLETIILGITSYIGTNIDDLLVNTIFFTSITNKKDNGKVLFGKYLGMGALILVSIIAALGLQTLPQKYIAFLGVIPIFLGIKEIISSLCHQKDNDLEVKDRTTALSIKAMIVTIANGADNIGVYIPLFASFELWQTFVVCAIFGIMTTVWCYISKRISELNFLRQFVMKYKKIIIPLVYIALGIYIFLKS